MAHRVKIVTPKSRQQRIRDRGLQAFPVVRAALHRQYHPEGALVPARNYPTGPTHGAPHALGTDHCVFTFLLEVEAGRRRYFAALVLLRRLSSDRKTSFNGLPIKPKLSRIFFSRYRRYEKCSSPVSFTNRTTVGVSSPA